MTSSPIQEGPWTGLFAASLGQIGADVAELIRRDRDSESASINMIASASYCPRAVRQAEGSHLVNKNASGFVGRRSMANCEEYDRIEELAIGRAKAMFGAEAVNVQALSSTLANLAVLRAIMKPGDGLLAFDEIAGGHISHGSAGHITGEGRVVNTFGVDDDDRLDLEAARSLAKALRPRVIVAGATSYPREIDFQGLRTIADEVGALLFSDIAHVAGLIAVGMHQNPVPFSDVATTSTQKTLCGPRSGAFTFSKREFADAIDAAIYPGLHGAVPANMVAARAILLDIAAQPAFADLMSSVLRNAKALGEGLMERGIDLYTGGTDTHMIVADLRDTDWRPAAIRSWFGRHGITGNGIRLPARKGSPSDAAYRFGSTAMSIRGADEAAFRHMGTLFGDIIRKGPNAAPDPSLTTQLQEIALAFPVPSYTD